MITKITTIILILGSILRNKVNGTTGFDVLKMKPLLDQLDDTIFEESQIRGLEHTVDCSNQDLKGCYKAILEAYEYKMQYDAAEIINNTILQLLANHNALVLKLMTTIQDYGIYMYYEGEDLAKLIQSLYFHHPNVYCVANFLRLFGISPNDKLKDSIFFNRITVYKINHYKDLKRLIFTHFKNEKDNLLSEPILDDPRLKLFPQHLASDIMEKFLLEAREKIKAFSEPFCNLNLPKINEDKWLWYELENSTLFSKKIYNSNSLLDWQDLKLRRHSSDLRQSSLHGDGESLEITRSTRPSVLLQHQFNYSMYDLWDLTDQPLEEDQTVRNLHEFLSSVISETIHDAPTDSDQSEEHSEESPSRLKESLQDIIMKQYSRAKFNEIDTFYEEVVTINDAYVRKVLFCRVLHLISGVLTSYYNVVRHFRRERITRSSYMDAYFQKIVNFGYEIDMFFITLDMFIDHLPSTLNKTTIKDMYEILIDARARFIVHIFRMDNPRRSVAIIRKRIKDPRFHRDSNDLLYENYSEIDHASELLGHMLNELELINTNLLHMIEVKIIPVA